MDNREPHYIPTRSWGLTQPNQPRLQKSAGEHDAFPIHQAEGPFEEEEEVSNAATSSDEDDTHPEDTASIVGISISRAQSRLKSPTTPAAEKAAAMEGSGGFLFGGEGNFGDSKSPGKGQFHSPDIESSDLSNSVHSIGELSLVMQQDKPPGRLVERDSVKSRTSPPPQLPSPWRAGPKFFEKVDESRPVDLPGEETSRERKASVVPERWMRIPASFPSLSKTSWLFGNSTQDDPQDKTKLLDPGAQKKTTNSSVIPQSDGPSWKRESIGDSMSRSSAGSGVRSPLDDGEMSYKSPDSTTRTSKDDSSSILRTPSVRELGLRRSASDQSLYLSRRLSKAPSLGDDSRFENVHEMMNNRFKAVKDSFQDSNFRLSLPKAPSIFGSKSDVASSGESTSGSWVRKSLMLPVKEMPSGDIPTSSERGGEPTKGRPTKAAGMSAAAAVSHPMFTEALDNLTGDIVVLGGYRGSILREAQAPRRRLWVPLKVGFNLRKVDLDVGFEDEDEEKAHEKIIADGMLTNIGPVDISRRLFKRLRASENAQTGRLRVHDYGYDWRLNPEKLSGEFVTFLEKLPCNAANVPLERRGATVIAHSLGGLIVRHAVNKRPELFAGVVYAGVPESCVNILGPFRHGDDVLFSSKVLTAQVNFSIRTSFAMLPLHGRCFLDIETKEEYPIDFFNVDDWVKYRLSPCVKVPLPPLAGAVPKKTGIMGSVSSMMPEGISNALPSMPFYKKDPKEAKDTTSSQHKTQQAASHAEGHFPGAGMAPQMGSNTNETPSSPQSPTNAASAQQNLGITITQPKALAYLARILPRIKRFREQLAHIPAHQSANKYPPLAVIYGKSEPTVYGARVHGRDGIARADAYDHLAFASGDGVVLARMAMLPEGYIAARSGVVETNRGHVTLLGDLEAVGRCLEAVRREREMGIGLGTAGRSGRQRDSQRKEMDKKVAETPHAPESEG